MLLVSLCSFSGCTGKEQSKVTRTELEQLEDTLDTVVYTYFTEKYGMKTMIKHQSIAGNVFLGPDASSEQYYNLTLLVTDGNASVECNAAVYGRRTEAGAELYVKKESYYAQTIKEAMEAWLEKWMEETDITVYHAAFTSTKELFPYTFEVGASVDEIVQAISSIEENVERPDLYWIVSIPESEYENHADIESMFADLRAFNSENNGILTVNLSVYQDEDYQKIISDEECSSFPIAQIKVSEYTE